MPPVIRVSVCVCTSGRPAELSRCLTSLMNGEVVPDEVIVSDDSIVPTVASAIREICSDHRCVFYAVGPQRGLCANRNAAVARATGTHVSLLDDDAIAGTEFIRRVKDALVEHPLTIFTGDVLEDGIRRQRPSNTTYLGHFGLQSSVDFLQNVNLNCNVFPYAALSVVQFDEAISYGYEDTDLCARLIEQGWKIRYCLELVNQHFPPPKTPGQLRRQTLKAETARGMVQVRLRRRRGRSVAALGWSAIAAMHACMSAVKHADLARLNALLTGLWMGWTGAV